eukprot:TRINITY_DN12560_c0_g1_i1.p1 TRINITY_DN12560_c0_g1~~TRINITY_DN12560_c0_g1_i1.p1  ORF type:complete len:300 (+),score=65.71 TRINITY_DN12560_c0_g1_i1:47-901(+)
MSFHRVAPMAALLLVAVVILNRAAGPLPPAVPRGHAVIAGRERLIIVGDVHGMYDEMRAVLAKALYVPARDTLVFTGDVGNKGPQTAEVVTWIMDAQARGEDVHTVLGNHDIYVAEGQGVAAVNDAQRRWLGSRPLSVTIRRFRVVVVHAGVLPGKPLQTQSLETLTTMRNYIPATRDGTKDPKRGEPWVDAFNRHHAQRTRTDVTDGLPSGFHVVFGHDAVRGLQRSPLATGIDTGCVYGDALTAMVYPGRELVTAPCREVAPKTITDPNRIPKRRLEGQAAP